MKNKESDRGKLLEQWNEAKKSLDHWVKETWCFGNQLNRNTEGFERMAGGMPFQKPVETVREVLEKISINEVFIRKENLGRALKNKESERGKLSEQWKKAKKSLEHWITEASFIRNKLIRNAEEFEPMGGGMPYQKPLESEAKILEKIFINKDSILKENLGRAFKKKQESEREQLSEQWKQAKESLIHSASETLFFEHQLHRNAEEIERICGAMQADCLEDWKSFQEAYH